MTNFVYDTFTDPDGTGLENHIGETGAVWTFYNEPTAPSNALQIKNNALIRPTSPTSGFGWDVGARASGLTTADFDIELVYHHVAPYAYSGIRINTSVNGEFEEYMVGLFTAASGAGGGQIDTLDGVTGFVFLNDTDYLIRIEVRGNQVQVFVDDALIRTATRANVGPCSPVLRMDENNEQLLVKSFRTSSVPTQPPMGFGLFKDLSTTITSPAVPGVDGTPGTVGSAPTPAYCVTTEVTSPSYTTIFVIDDEGVVHSFAQSGAPVTSSVTVCYPATPGVAPTPGTPPIPGKPASVVVDYNLGWNAGARSIEPLVADGSASFSVGTSVIGAAVGLCNEGAIYAFAEASHALYFRGGFVSVLESGTARTGVVPYTVADIFRIERAGSLVRYYQNATLLYVSDVPSYGTRYLEASMYSGGDVVTYAALGDTTTVGGASGDAVMQPVAAAGGDTQYAYGTATLAQLTSSGTGYREQGGVALLSPLKALGSNKTYAAGNATLRPLSARGEAGAVPAFALGYTQLGYIGAAGHGVTSGISLSPATSLGDSDVFWADNTWSGLTVYITSGTGAGQSLVIATNTGQSLLFNTPWSTIPDATSFYEIRSATGAVLASGYVTPATSSMMPLNALGADYEYAGGNAVLKALTSFSSPLIPLNAWALITAPMATLVAHVYDSTDENAANITAPMATLSAYMGMGAKIKAPMPTLSASATGVNWLKASVRAPMATLEATGTVSGTSQANITAPMATAIGYGGMVARVTTTGGVTLNAHISGGGVLNANIVGPMATLDLFEVTTESHFSIDVVAPMGKMGATLQAYILAPMATLTAAGTATVAASYEAYAINLNHTPKRGVEPIDEVTRYTNFPFTQVLRYKGSYFGVAADGLYLLEGTTDDTVPIPWDFKTATHDFKDVNKKTLASTYFGGRLGAAASVTLYAGEDAGTAYSYSTPRDSAAQNFRQKFGKGLKERYYAVRVAGTGVMELDNIDFDVHSMTRRI